MPLSHSYLHLQHPSSAVLLIQPLLFLIYVHPGHLKPDGQCDNKALRQAQRNALDTVFSDFPPSHPYTVPAVPADHHTIWKSQYLLPLICNLQS